jgi:hypothetical protein
MIALDRSRAAAAPASAALYESHYLTAVDPDGGRALWLRYTTLKRAGEPARATVWLTFFDRSADGPRAWRVTAPEPLGDPLQAWSRSSLGEIGPAGARGAISRSDAGPAGGAGDAVRHATWDLSWRPHAGELPYLPARRLYDRAVPRSNGVALVPAATATGGVVLDGDEVAVDGWDAMVGHNWGAEHPHRWCWMHAGGLGDDGQGWLDLALVRIKLGPLVTPWIASGALHLDGRTYAPAPLRQVSCDHAQGRTTVALALSPTARLRLLITAPEPATVTWDYGSPSGPGRSVENCSVADATLELESSAGARCITLSGTVAVEHGAPTAG